MLYYGVLHLSFELRAVISVASMIYLIYHMKIIDQMMKYFLIRYLSRKLSVPVTVDEVRFKTIAVELRGISIRVPNDEETNWTNSVLIYIGHVVVKFDILRTISEVRIERYKIVLYLVPAF